MQITTVIVLYNQALTDCLSYESLKKVFDLLPIAQVLIYDNSPQPQTLPSTNMPLSYYHDERNKGLVPAYNMAANIAKENGSDWLLLLDQDTQLSVSYAESLTASLKKISTKTAFICPRINSAGVQISPVHVVKGMALSQKAIEQDGIHTKAIMAINSACLINLQFLDKIGAYPDSYELEYVDHWFCRKAYQLGYHGFVLETLIDHDLSLSDFENKISYDRYRKILSAERHFYQSEPIYLRFFYLLLLLKRYLYFLLKVKDKKYSHIISKHILKILFRRQ